MRSSTTHIAEKGKNYHEMQRFRTIFDAQRRVETILDNHVPSLDEYSRERERGRGDREKKKKGEKKWTQVQINLIPWRQRIERYVRSRLRENPVTIVTRFAKCVLSLSRALTAVIDEYKANVSRPRKLGKNGRKGATWHASPNGKFSERFRAISFFFLSLSHLLSSRLGSLYETIRLIDEIATILFYDFVSITQSETF